MDQPTILQSFNLTLPRGPEIVFGFNGSYREIKSTVSSTINQQALEVFVKEDNSLYKSIAERFFPPMRPFSPLQASMPVLEKTHHLDSESDVSRLSILQLIHPVNIALQEICPTGTTLVCTTEKRGSSTSRFDVQWALHSGRGERLTILAILEIKNTHVIWREDFEPAGATEQNYEAQLAKALQGAPFTLLKKNASWLSRQANKYSDHCDYVAVFDWNAMFIFNYALAKSTGGGAVRGTYFDERGQLRGMTFRRLLFAFVARPLKKYETLSQT